MKVIVQDKDTINQVKEYLYSLLKESKYFYTIASEEDIDSIIDASVDECWFFTGQVHIQKEFEELKNKIKEKLPRKKDGSLYDVYESWGDIEYKFIISEAILAIKTIKDKKKNVKGKKDYPSNNIDEIIKKK